MNAGRDILTHIIGNSPLLLLMLGVGWSIVSRLQKLEVKIARIETKVDMHIEQNERTD